MCSRCLRSVDDRNMLEEGSSIAGTEDDEDRSYLELMSNPAESANTMYRPAVSIKVTTMLCNALKRLCNYFHPTISKWNSLRKHSNIFYYMFTSTLICYNSAMLHEGVVLINALLSKLSLTQLPLFCP